MSADGGSVWTCIDSYFLDGGAFVIDPNDTATYWSGGNHYDTTTYVKSVSKSTDAGVTWTRYDLTTANGSCKGIAVDPTDSDIVYAAGYPGFHRTTNGGSSWQQVTGGIAGNTYAVVIDYSNPSIIYVGGTNGIFKSTSGGNNWTNMGLSAVNAILIDPENSEIVYAGTATGVHMSTDGGNTWQVMNDGLEDLRVTSLGVFPGYYLFCGTDIGGMYRWDISTGIEELHDDHAVHVLFAVPNPMRHNTAIAYHLPADNKVRLSVYDVQGRLIDELVNAQQAAGAYQQYWDCTDTYGLPVAAGVYFCRLTVGGSNDLVKLVVTR
jgi:hypothetical protein